MTDDLPAAVAHDDAAEKAVLGIVLADPDSPAEARRFLAADDFHKPVHQILFATVARMDDARKPIEPAAVVSELTRTGDLKRIPGGAAYVTDLYGDAPPSASLSHYARIVKEASTRRALNLVGMRMQQMSAIDGDATPAQIVEQMRSTLDELAVQRLGSDVPLVGEVLNATLEEIDRLATQGAVIGIPTGFKDLDRALNGLAPGQMITIAARPGVGKALALDTPLATPSGWTTMGEVQAGDQVMGRDGRPTTVVAATEAMHRRPCYRVTFSDGSQIVADAQHLWVTETESERKKGRSLDGTSEDGNAEGVRTTEEIAATITSGGKANHAVRVACPLDLPEAADLPVAPYALGAWLAGGATPDGRFPGADPDAFDGEHIPLPYLRASVAQRRALLAGLLDTDGTVDATGRAILTAASARLAHDFTDLVAGLGYCCSVATPTKERRGENSPVAFTVAFAPGAPGSQGHEPSRERPRYRHITDVVAVDTVPVRCIQVDNDDHTYLAGNTMIPTHNSSLALDIARHAAFRQDKAVMVFSLEMSAPELVMRLLSAESYVDMTAMRSGQMDEQHWQQLAKASARMSTAKLAIDDTATVTLAEIRAKARAFQRANGLDLIVIDYLQLMNADRRSDSRQQEVSDMSRGVKLLAKEFKVPVIILSQLNRGSEQRADKRPMVSDLRESGSIEQDSDIVILIHREEIYEPESPKAGTAEVIIGKNRSGGTPTITLAWLAKMTTFQNLAIE